MKKTILSILLLSITAFSYAQVGKSLYTDGVNDYVLVPDNNALDLVTDFTVECWIRPELTDNNMMILRKGWCNGHDFSYYLSVDNGVLKWAWTESGNCDYPSGYKTVNSVILPEQCTHVTIVHSSTEVKIYVDNVLVPGLLFNGSYSSIYSSSERLEIATYRSFSGTLGSYYKGTIDEMRFWNYKLTQQEIISYSSGSLSGSEPGLVVYFDMEDNGAGSALTITNKATVSGSITGNGFGTATTPMFANSCTVVNGVAEQTVEDIHVYPNPTTSSLYVDISKSQVSQVSVELYDFLGRVVYNGRYNQRSFYLDMKEYSNGVYLLLVKDGSGKLIKSEKVVKQ